MTAELPPLLKRFGKGWPYAALGAATLFLYSLPRLAVGIPLKFLYFITDVPLHAAGAQRILCRACFARDALFIGDLRPLGERYFFYPSMAGLERLTGLDVGTVGWFLGAIFSLTIIFAAYWTLEKLTSKKWLSLAGAAVLIFGVQAFGGIWLGGMGGGFNTHSLAEALAAILLGLFIVEIVKDDGSSRFLWLFPAAAVCMNLYPLVFPQLMIFMAVYAIVFRRVRLAKLALVLVACAPLFPVAWADFLILRARPSAARLEDLRQVMKFNYIDLTPDIFISTLRRFLVPAALLGMVVWLKTKLRQEAGPGERKAVLVLGRMTAIAAVFTAASIAIDQFSPGFMKLQFTGGMAQIFFLAVLYWLFVEFASLKLSGARLYASAAALELILLVFVSNSVFSVNYYRVWLSGAAAYRDRGVLLDALKSLPPADAVFMSDPNRMAIEIRGFAGRAALVAEKDRGAAELDATRFDRYREIYAKVSAADFDKDSAPLKALAREYGADYVVAGVGAIRPGDEVVYRNGSYAVIKP